MTAVKVGSAALVGGAWLLVMIANIFSISCAGRQDASYDPANVFDFRVARARAPSDTERYCSWYGSARGGVLFFGQAAFWSSYREAGGDPRADLEQRGPQLIGRFDLAREELLPPLDTGVDEARSGVWDVLAHPNGRVYFTTYFESAGYVDPATGRVKLFEGLGPFLNELALGPGQDLLVSRYAGTHGGSGSVLLVDPEGRRLREYPLPAAKGFVVAPKTVAYDPAAAEIWVTTDLLSNGSETGSTPPEVADHPALVLERDGSVRVRIAIRAGASGGNLPPLKGELQFVRFDSAGQGYFALVRGAQLELRVLSPTEPDRGIESARPILLDASFPRDFDFVQDLQVAEDGRVVVTRWSGAIHVVSPDGEFRTLAFPRLSEGGLYYTAVARGERICATHCADVTVVCGPGLR